MPGSRRGCIQLDSPQKNRLVGCIIGGSTITKVATDNEIPISTLNTIYRKYRETGTVSRRAGSGRPRKLNERSERGLIKFVKANRRTPLNSIGNSVVPAVCGRTVQRTLDRHGYHRRHARRKPHLTQKKKDQRLAHSRAMLEMDDSVHDHIIWSDECYVQVGDTPGAIYVTRTAGEEYAEDCTVPTFKASNLRVMVWGAIARKSKGPLIVLEYPGGRGGGMNTERYISQVLEGPLLGYYEGLVGERNHMYFMQDGASCHKSKRTKEWLDKACITLHPHPPSSPDLNPIEPCWADLKRLISQRPHHPSNLEELTRAVLEAWEELTTEMIDKHTNSMQTRYREVVEASGGNTRF